MDWACARFDDFVSYKLASNYIVQPKVLHGSSTINGPFQTLRKELIVRSPNSQTNLIAGPLTEHRQRQSHDHTSYERWISCPPFDYPYKTPASKPHQLLPPHFDHSDQQSHFQQDTNPIPPAAHPSPKPSTHISLPTKKSTHTTAPSPNSPRVVSPLKGSSKQNQKTTPRLSHPPRNPIQSNKPIPGHKNKNTNHPRDEPKR